MSVRQFQEDHRRSLAAGYSHGSPDAINLDTTGRFVKAGPIGTVRACLDRSALTLFWRRIPRQERDRFLHRRHELGGEDDGGILLDRYFRHGLQGAELKRYRVLRDDVGRLAELYRRLVFAFGGDDFGATLAFGLGFLGHRALHVVGQRDVLDLDRRYLGAPRLGVLVDDVLDLLIDARGIRQQLVDAEATDHIAHGGLADLIDRVVDVFDRDHGLFRIGDVIISDRRDIDRNIVLGDDLLRRDLHGDGAQRHAHHLLDRNEDQRQSRPAHAGKFAEQKHHPALILFQHPKRNDDIESYRYGKKEDPVHGVLIICRARLLRSAVSSVSRDGRAHLVPGPETSTLSAVNQRPSLRQGQAIGSARCTPKVGADKTT